MQVPGTPNAVWSQVAAFGPVSAVATQVMPGGQVIAITGGGDHTVRRWDLTTGQPIGGPLTGHTDWVSAVATQVMPDGQVIAVTGGGRMVRRWDLTTGQPIGDPLTGHTGPVQALAMQVTPDGQVIAVTGGDDHTVRRWDLTTGQPIGDPLTGHTDWVSAVATQVMPDGQVIAVTGGDDHTVRRWDLTTGQPIGDPLTGHTGWVSAVATQVTPDGRVIAVTGGGDRSIRFWDVLTGGQIVAVPVDHGGVTCVAFAAIEGFDSGAVVTGSRDGMLHVWDVAELLKTHAIGVDEAFAGENTGAADRLSRAGLASHLAARLRQLTTGERSPAAAAADPTGSGIVHLDGRWGAGKTTLVELMLRERSRDLGRPVVVRYDAWRNAAIAPEWWSVAAEIRRAVHGSRAAPTRVVMTLAGYARRLARSTSTWLALLVVAAAGVAGRWLVTGPRDVPQQFTAVLGVLTSISGVLAVVFVLTRGLFWSAPVLGRLHMRTDDNPLAEISGVVGQLRRWTPRERLPQKLIDWVFSLWLAACIAMALWWKPAVTLWRRLPADIHDDLVRAIGIVVIIGIGVNAIRSQRHQQAPTAPEPAQAPAPASISRAARLRQMLTRAARSPDHTALAVVVVGLTGWLGTPLWALAGGWWRSHLDPATRSWILAATAGTLAYIMILAATASRHRRMLILIIDDLDRCDGERVVRLLETIHTMLRERSAPRRLRRWRDPAPLAVIVAASGRWIRDAFSKHYETFDRKNPDDAVHDLGADFLQKIFDHSILVPGLSPEQTDDLIHVVSGSRHQPTTPHRLRSPTTTAAPADRSDRRESTGHPKLPEPAEPKAAPAPTATDPATALTPPTSTPPPTSQLGGDSRQRQDERANADTQAAQSDLSTNAPLLITHLLTNYAAILPRNPRQIIRVAAAWAMLRAVARSLNLETDAEPANEILVRAAVIWVRFPALVDELLDADRLPTTDPATSDCPPKWRRHDVQQVLTMDAGHPLDIEDLALYFGKYFPPQNPAPPTSDVT